MHVSRHALRGSRTGRGRRSSILPLVGLLLVTVTQPILASTYFVAPDGSGDFPTIQAAITAANHGDVVQLGDGIFNGAGNYDISFSGKAITVESLSGNPEACIVDAEASAATPRRVFTFAFEGPSSVLRGVTITGGYKTSG